MDDKTAPKKKLILVCEDDPDANAMVTDFLVSSGYDVRSCADGMQAANYVRTTAFDMIMMDIRIPSMNGMQVCAIARSSQLNRSAKIIVITGDMDPNTAIRAEALKVTKFLQKPVSLDQLGQIVKAVFEEADRKVSYDVRIINAFLEAAIEIYEFYFNEKPQRGKIISRVQGKPEKGFCTGLIALTGDGFVGSLGVTMTAPFIKRLASILFEGMDVKFDNEFIGDLTGEMCNQILGKVKINFAKIGIPVTIGLPEVILGKDHIIHHKVSNPVICVPMGKDSCVFELQFVLSQRDVKIKDANVADVPPASVILFD